MKKKKKVWALAGLVFFLAMLLGIYLWMKGSDESQENVESGTEDETETTDYILNWNEEKTRKISIIVNGGEKITFEKDDETWKMLEYEKIPLVKDEITSMIGYASEIAAVRTIEGVEDLSEYGLDNPLNVIERETEDGETESFAIGIHSDATGCSYIYLNDQKDVVYAVEKNLGNLYKYDFLDFVESEAYPTFVSDNVQKVEVVKEEGSFALWYDFSVKTCWMVEDEVYGKKLADEDQGENLASMVSVLSYSEFYEYDCQDFSVYGLDEPQMEIRVTYHETVEMESEENAESTSGDDSESDDVAETETVVRNLVIYVGGYDENGYYYVRVNDSKEVHGIAATHIDKLLGETSLDYWALNMNEVSLDDLDYVDVEYGGKIYTMKKVVTETVVEGADTEENAEDDADETQADGDYSDDAEEEPEVKKVTTYYVNDVEVDEDDFEEFYSNAIGIACQERMLECETEEDAELTMNFHGVKGENVTVCYIPWDENFYAVINNDTDFGLVNKMNVKSLIALLLNVVE